MKYKYKLLKASWGIVIYLEIDELRNSELLESDILIASDIYIRLNDSIQWYTREIALKYIVAGLKALVKEIKMKIGDTKVCFYIKDIDYNEAHFQEEGLYCAIQEWISQYYNIKIKPIHIEFDASLNKYLFNFPL